MAVIDELVTLLSIKLSSGSKENVKALDKALGSVANTVVRTGEALGTAGTSLALLSSHVAHSINLQNKFAASVGVSYQSLQALQFATKRSGGTADGLSSSIAALSKELNPQLPGEYNQVLYLMGIRTRNVDQSVLELADHFQKFSNVQALNIGEKLGFTPAFIRVLQTGRKGIAQMAAEAKLLGAIITPEQAHAAIRFDNSMLNIRAALSGITKTVAAGLSPAMEKLDNNFLRFLVTNKQVINTDITSFITGITSGVGMFSSVVVKAASALGGLDKSFTGSQDAGQDFQKVLEGLTFVALTSMTVKVALLTSRLLGLTAALSAVKTALKVFPAATAYGALALGTYEVAKRNEAISNKRAAQLVSARDKGYAGKTGSAAVFARAKDLGSFVGVGGGIPGLPGVVAPSSAVSNIQAPPLGSYKKHFPFSLFHHKSSAVNHSAQTTMHITQNINGAQNPTAVANAVSDHLSDLGRSVHKTAGGFNRGTVS